MRTCKVVYSDQAQTDLLEMELWLEARAGKVRARSYVDRLIDKCEKLEFASKRGTQRNDISPGLRTIGFERRVTIVFVVDETQAEIVRIFPYGRDWESEFTQD